jgi:hypothetical protein
LHSTQHNATIFSRVLKRVDDAMDLLPNLQPCNSLLLARTSNPEGFIFGSQLHLQERALELEWLGENSAAIRNMHLQVVMCGIRLCVLVQESVSRLRENFGELTQLRMSFNKIGS